MCEDIKKLWLIFCGIICLLITCVDLAADTVVLDDNFEEYANTTAMLAVWNSSGSVSLATDDTNYLYSNNGLSNRALSQTVENDWTLNVKIGFTALQRSQQVLLLDSTGSKGYNFYFSDGTDGTVTCRVTRVDSQIAWSTFIGTQVGNFAYSGYKWSDASPFMDATITWEKDTGTLSVAVNATVVLSVQDTTYSSFDKIYLCGNTYGCFDNIVLTTVPEPVTVSLLILGGIGISCFRKRRCLR